MEDRMPTNSSDVAIAVAVKSDGGTTSTTGDDLAYREATGETDHNGLITGRWKVGLFDCVDSMVPNAVMSCCCPAVSLAQISARIGLSPFYLVLVEMLLLYVLALLAVIASSIIWKVLFFLAMLVTFLLTTRLRWRLRMLFSIPGSPFEDLMFAVCCGFFSIAQMATHVESYKPGAFSLAPRETLPGYTFE